MLKRTVFISAILCLFLMFPNARIQASAFAVTVQGHVKDAQTGSPSLPRT